MMTAINLKKLLHSPVHIAPLVVFRIAFGAVLFVSCIRFMAHGWVTDFYISPRFHFPFYGFEWVKPLPLAGMYAVYVVMTASALMICAGLFYRTGAILFCLCFVYTTLLDKTYYLNHYYLVSLLSLLLILVPANRFFSLDVLRNPALQKMRVPAWTINIFKCQLAIVYVYAGLSKLNTDWLINAMPLKIWLPAKQSLPVIGKWLALPGTAVLFSYGGMLFDLSIVFLLLYRRTRPVAYLLVIVFHLLTAILFQIGMFPYIMLVATLIFFSESFHLRVLNALGGLYSSNKKLDGQAVYQSPRFGQPAGFLLLLGYFLLQVLVPVRCLLYPGKLLWTEEGYRFSWRVMLMEKSGTTFFHIVDSTTNRQFEVNNSEFLTAYQERMMETQPDMMLQYAKLLQQHYRQTGYSHAGVRIESYVSLNGRGSQLFIDSSINLANEKESWFQHKKWILPSQPSNNLSH